MEIVNKLMLVHGSSTVSEEEYSKWKSVFSKKSEADKLIDVIGPVSQWLLDPESHAASSVMVTMMMCINKYISELDNGDF